MELLNITDQDNQKESSSVILLSAHNRFVPDY